MKNKKIISITVCLVAAVLVGMLGLSVFFESTWQHTEQTDNNLSVEIVEDVESVFDYPYKRGIEVSEDDLERLQMNLILAYPLKDFSNDMISYQQASNIAGEVLKFIYGCTEHQTDIAIIELIDFAKMYDEEDIEVYYKEFYLYGYRIAYDNKSELEYQCGVDPYTGDVIYIFSRDRRDTNELVQYSADSDFWIEEITDEDYKIIKEKAQDMINIIKPGAIISDIELEYTVMVSRGKCYLANITLTDGTKLEMCFDKQYENNNQLVKFTLPLTS